MNLEDFIEEYRSKLDKDIQALKALIERVDLYLIAYAGHPDFPYYIRESMRLKSKLEGVRLARSHFNELVKLL